MDECHLSCVAISRGRPNKHGFHLLQAMRFAVEEINNRSTPQPLLPGVKLGYQMYDICSVPASVLATLDLLAQQSQDPSEPETEEDSDGGNSQRAVAVIGPDSSSKSFTPASLLGAFLIPQVSSVEFQSLPCEHDVQQFLTSSMSHCRSPMKPQMNC